LVDFLGYSSTQSGAKVTSFERASRKSWASESRQYLNWCVISFE